MNPLISPCLRLWKATVRTTCLWPLLAMTSLGTAHARAAATVPTEPTSCWAHPGHGTSGRSIVTSGAPNNLLASRNSGRVFATYQYRVTTHFDGTCVIGLDSTTGGIARVRTLDQGILPPEAPSAGTAADNRTGALVLALSGYYDSHLVLLSQRTLQTLHTVFLRGTVDGMAVLAASGQIYVSTSAGCPKSCRSRTYILDARRLHVLRVLDLGPVQSVDLVRRRVFESRGTSTSLVAINGGSGRIQWVASEKGMRPCGAWSADLRRALAA